MKASVRLATAQMDSKQTPREHKSTTLPQQKPARIEFEESNNFHALMLFQTLVYIRDTIDAHDTPEFDSTSIFRTAVSTKTEYLKKIPESEPNRKSHS